MASEITQTIGLRVSNGSLYVEKQSSSTAIDQTTAAYSANTQAIGLTEEQVEIASGVATPGVSYFKNLDDANTIEIGKVVSATFYPLIQLLPGESCTIRLATDTFHARASATAGADLEVLILAE